MHKFLNLVGYEYRMSIQRWGVWLAFGLLGAFFGISFLLAPGNEELPPITEQVVWQTAGQIALFVNVLLPVVGGLAASDRLVRDFQLGLAELQNSTPLHRYTYILSKYCGVWLSLLTPILILDLLVMAVTFYAYPGLPLTLIPITLVAFLAINVPAYAFITIFSLACPLIMPLRVYQILFTGYWFWGNFLNPEFIPTLNGTLLTPVGRYAAEAFFGGFFSVSDIGYTPLDAVLNWLVLALCIVAAMFTLERYLAWKARRA